MARPADPPSGGTPDAFRVQPEFLTPLATTLDDLSSDATEAASYSRTHADIDPSGGSLMARLADLTFHISDDLERGFERLSEITSRASDEIIASRNLYRTMDAESAARVDAEYWSN